ncbi:hypothetical protein GWG54_17915 [Natronococcus sp. JC468]|uniref:hypothetical protein n=1 Tax=Natronococcus sp. JC468 TaxID=1961921 RepID=UPI001439921B|nr:hypothetical protein [Natronococcus sp. JC468]NKE37646.1 hypothetical protein [Natronococcus sp. JC468]
MSQTSLETLLGDGRTNAAISWLLVVAIAAIGLGALVTGGILWATFAVVLLAFALLPPLSRRSPLVMLPWEVLLLAALPVFGAAFGADRLSGHVTSYLSVAAIALVLAVELQAFTSVRMTPGFAVVFVAVATMAAAALWALLRWTADGVLGVPFTADHDDVMWEFVYSTVSGLGAGAVFELYFRRLDDLERSRCASGGSDDA